MWGRITTIGAACMVLCACQKAETPKRHQATELEKAQEKYAAWASKQPRPSPQIVDRIEALLAKDPCVGRLDRWSRSYAYNEDTSTRKLYPKIIDFHLEEAGKLGVQPGRHITEPNSWVTIDDRPLKMADGDYDIIENRVRLGFCGNNVGPAAAEIDRMRAYWKELDRRRSAQQSVREQ